MVPRNIFSDFVRISSTLPWYVPLCFAVFLPESNKNAPAEVEAFMVDANGLEPLTPCTSSRCSSQLS